MWTQKLCLIVGLRCDLQGGELRHVAEGERGKKTDAVITEVSAEETHTNTQQIQLHVYNMPSQSEVALLLEKRFNHSYSHSESKRFLTNDFK